MAGGIHGSIGTIPIGDKVSASSLSITELSKQLGLEIEGTHGKAYRLVRLDLAAGMSSFPAVAARCFVYTASSTYDVEPADTIGSATAATRVVGLSVGGQVDLDDNDLFWVQIDGRFTAELGDGTAWGAVGDYIRPSGDTDLGKFEEEATATTYVENSTIAKAVGTVASDGDTSLADIVRRLR